MNLGDGALLINEMIIFYYVVKYKSFSQAANTLNVSKSHVSKHITQLEQELKSRLLNRSTRQLSMTDAGEIFYQHCEKLLALAEQSYTALANFNQQPTGTLKISVPPALGMHLLSEPLIQYQRKYPDVKLNIVLESQIVDLIQNGYDLTLRSALLADSNLIARKLGMFRNILCVSPKYLKKHDPIKTPEQLEKHVFAVYSGNPLARQLKFEYNKQNFKTIINNTIESNSLDMIAQMVMGDCCLAVLPEFMVKDKIAKKKLVHCLPQYCLPDSPLYAIYPDKKYMPLKVKVFLSEIESILKQANFKKP